MAYVVGEICCKICNQGIRCPTKRRHKTPVYNADETKEKGVNAVLKFLSKISYNELILYQENTVCLHIL